MMNSNEHKMDARMKTRMMTMIENNDERSNADNNGNSDGNGECIMFSLSTAASILGVSPAHLNRAISLGALPVVMVNGARWVGARALSEYSERARSLNERITARVADPDRDFKLLDEMW